MSGLHFTYGELTTDVYYKNQFCGTIHYLSNLFTFSMYAPFAVVSYYLNQGYACKMVDIF